MADYQLSYSGEEIDKVCEKIGKFRVGWGHRIVNYDIYNHHTTHLDCNFNGIFPEEFLNYSEEDKQRALILVSCDYGGMPFDMACISYKRVERDVRVEGLVRPGDRNPGVENEPGNYAFKFYCLVIFREDGGESI